MEQARESTVSAASLALFVAALSSTALAQAPRYTYRVMIDGYAGPYSFSTPAIDEQGRVAAERIGPGNTREIVISDRATTIVAADNSGPIANFYGTNTNFELSGGHVVFLANLVAGGTALLRGDGSTLDEIVRSTQLPPPLSLSGTIFDHAVNSAGDVAFVAAQQQGQSQSALFRRDFGAASATPILWTGAPSGVLGIHSVRLRDDRGLVALVRPTSAPVYALDSISALGSTTRLVTSTSSPFGCWPSLPFGALASGGVIYLGGALETDRNRVGAATASGITELAALAPPWSSFANVAASPAGRIAISGGVSPGSLSLVADGADPVAHRVLGAGDTLAGRTIDMVTMGRDAINDAGQIALHVRFVTPTPGYAIVRADPITTVGASFCEGSGGCPCGNNSANGAGEGCANLGGSGSKLVARGLVSIAAGQLWFEASGLSGGTALLFQGSGQVSLPIGDGLRCAGGQVRRLGLATPSAAGTAYWGPALAVAGAWQAGDTRFFQVWYRNGPASPCPSAQNVNFSSGVALTFAP